MWPRRVESLFEVTNQTSLVYEKLQRADSLAAHFGVGYANMTVISRDVAVYVSALNHITSPEDYNDIKLNAGPFVVPTLPSQPVMATNLVGGQILAEALGKILSTKDDRKENTRLTKDLVKLKSAFMGALLILRLERLYLW